MINRTSRKFPGQSNPPEWDLCRLSFLHKQPRLQGAQLLSHLASIKGKCLPCYHLGDRWAPQAGSKSLNVDRGQEQSHLSIEIHCDHETYFWQGKKCLLTYKFSWSLTKQLPFLSFPAKHVMFRGEEAKSSSSFMLQTNFSRSCTFFCKLRLCPSSISLLLFAFTSFGHNVIISPRKGKIQCSIRKTSLKHYKK